jgi:hypothetical protein
MEIFADTSAFNARCKGKKHEAKSGKNPKCSFFLIAKSAVEPKNE